MRRPTETDLVRQCLDLLKLRGVYAWRNNSGAFVLGKGSGRRFFRAGAKGSADVIGVLPGSGRFLAVECKVGSNQPTADQVAFLDAVRAAGGVAVVIRDVAELVALLDDLQAGRGS